MLNMSFYDGTLDKEEAIKAIIMSDKPCKYTYGFKYKNPTTYEVPIPKEEAIQIIKDEFYIDIFELEDYFDIIAYGENDMW